MSASREKKSRKENLNTAESAELKAAQQKKKKSILTGVLVTLAVVLLIGTIVLFRGPFFRTHSTALTVGEHEITPATLRYYYCDAFSLVSEQYGDMMGYLYSNGTRFDEAQYSEDQTWGEYLLDFAVEQARTDYAVYDLLLKEGYQPSAECTESINSTQQTLELYSGIYGVTVDAYLRSVYGNGSALSTYLDYQKIRNTVADYVKAKETGFTYTEDELNAAYAEQPSDYNAYTFHSYLVSGFSDEMDDEAAAAAMTDAQAAAEKIAEESKGDLDKFLALCTEQAGEDLAENGSTLRSEYLGSQISAYIKDWITSPDRQEGDTTAIPYEEFGCYVLYFVSSSDNSYKTVNARVIPVELETAEDGSVDWAKTNETLTAVQAAFEAGKDSLDATFETLAVTYSADENTAYDGGKFTQVSHATEGISKLVSEWLFDEARQPGDSAVLTSDTEAAFVYFEDFSDSYRNVLITSTLRSADYAAWYEDITKDTVAEQNSFGMGYLNRELVYSYTGSGY